MSPETAITTPHLVLIKMQAEYGIGISHALIHAYDSPERAIAVEREYLLKRSKIIEGKKK